MENEKNIKEMHEAYDIIEKYVNLQKQINNPSRDGMIKALSDAQKIASNEITNIEHIQGDIYQVPWASVPDNDLYRKLSQYQMGLLNHAINKFGEKKIKKLLEEHTGK